MALALAAPAAVAPTAASAAHAAAGREAREAASCAFIVWWEGRKYEALGVQVSPRVGRRVGTGTSPACDDTNENTPEPPERYALARVRGVPPADAVAIAGREDVVLVRARLFAQNAIPAAVKLLQRAPRCESSGTVALVGPWLGALGPRGEPERDLEPPYDLHMHVRRSSRDRYERAFLKVRATRQTSGLITREDVENVLWEGGNLWATVRCVRGRYVAIRLDARAT
jgi:hypothetical protein